MAEAGQAEGAAKPRPPRLERPGQSGQLLAQWNPTSTDEERRAFYQRRVALLATVFFWIFVVLLAWVNLMYIWVPELQPKWHIAVNSVSLGALVVLGSVAYLLNRRDLSTPALFIWDILIAELIGLMLGIASVLSPDKPTSVVSMFIWATFLVFARVCFVPSRGARTALISTGVFLTQLAAVATVAFSRGGFMGVPATAFVIGVAGYSAIATLLATLGSEIFYGLRKQVQEAHQLGQYTLVEEIGTGGMGTVYRARHAMLRRPTALKLLKSDNAGAADLTRFEREVQLTSELTHPNTIAIFDYGRSPDGVFYYAMEYLDGINLEQLVKLDGPQDSERVVHILAQICGALDEAHDRGLIHRDIKPANIILCWRGKVPDVAKVLDFGLVKDVEDNSISASDAVAGTPAYLSPETIKAPDRVGPSSDLYALGAVAYYLLTGHVVFPAQNVVEMCVHHVSSVPQPPSERTERPISPQLESLILECLAKEPEDRPASAGELRQRLLALPGNGSWTDERAAQWWTQNAPRIPGPRVSLGEQSTMTVDLADREELAPGGKAVNRTYLGI